MAPKTQPLTPLELEIMNLLWDHGPATVTELLPRMTKDPAYTTVMTMLNILLRKGNVMRTQEGRAYRYRPAVTRARATGSALEDLVKRMFGGSDEALLLAFVETRGVTAGDLERLSKIVAESERTKAAKEDA